MSTARKYPPFIKTQIGYWLIAFNTMMVLYVATELLLPGPAHMVVGVFLALLSIGLTLYVWRNLHRIFSLLSSLHEQLGLAGKGEFHHRAVHTRDMGGPFFRFRESACVVACLGQPTISSYPPAPPVL